MNSRSFTSSGKLESDDLHRDGFPEADVDDVMSDDHATAFPSDEHILLMSMALDGLLDDEEWARFEQALEESPELAKEWTVWQMLDEQFVQTPSVHPPRDFVASVEKRLVVAERRRQLWLGALIGVVSVLLWGGILIGAGSLLFVLLVNPGEWASGLTESFAFWSVTLRNWVDALGTMSRTVLGTPQALGAVVGYILLSIAILTFWMRFLQRSVRTSAAASSFRTVNGS